MILLNMSYIHGDDSVGGESISTAVFADADAYKTNAHAFLAWVQTEGNASILTSVFYMFHGMVIDAGANHCYYINEDVFNEINQFIVSVLCSHEIDSTGWEIAYEAYDHMPVDMNKGTLTTAYTNNNNVTKSITLYVNELCTSTRELLIHRILHELGVVGCIDVDDGNMTMSDYTNGLSDKTFTDPECQQRSTTLNIFN